MKRLSPAVTVMLALLAGGPAWAGPLINERLPPFLQADLQFRYRIEARDNFDFNDSVDDKDAVNLYRSRLNLAVLPNTHIRLFTQWQDARISHSQFINKAPYEDYMDMRQGNIQLIDVLRSTDGPEVGLTLGRQEFAYGNQRVLGGFDWSNIANQTFDAGKASLNFKAQKMKIDVFGGSLTPSKSPREFNDFADGTSNDAMGGYYASSQIIPKVTLEQYLIVRKTHKNVSFGPSGSHELNEYTIGGRIAAQEIRGFDYELESAWQGGDFDEETIKAMMGVVVVGYTAETVWKPRAALEFDYGSGDNNSSDGIRSTFDNLYPTNHLHYGYMDLVSLQNLNDWRFQLSAKPTSKLKLQGDLHLIYLDTYKDSMYSAGRSVTRTAAAANGSDVGTHVGNEIDLTAVYKFCDALSVQTGYSHFFAGRYLAQTGANDDADFAYAQTTFTF